MFKKSGEMCAKLLRCLDITSLRGAATETTVWQPSSHQPCRYCGVGGRESTLYMAQYDLSCQIEWVALTCEADARLEISCWRALS